MINTYDSYVKESGAITIEQMRKMHENMMLEIGEDEDALELYDDLCNAIFPYADLRAKWHTFSIEEKDAGKRSTVERAIRRRESR